MKFQKLTLLLCLMLVVTAISQTKDPATIYRKEKEKINDLVHTKLNVAFDFDKKQLIGEEWLTLRPHFYTTDKLTLDAKAMIIHSIELDHKELPYHYDGFKIRIELPRKYTKEETYTLHISYTARPEKVTQKGSAAITGAKGLYFINADGSDKNKPTQIWTQGETEASSCWFPTIDSPNQKTSQEIYITVPDRFKTLSNGKLVSQIKKGTLRTDYWKFDQKHAPYLFFMGIGDYEIVKDNYKNIPIEYYVEKKYAPLAKQIFGLTPEMMEFFSTITGVEYPWNKYSQIVGKDYVSGAMENTTAVIHGEKAYQMAGQLVDENVQENTIAHELFHHWFGNLVTAESWSNLTVNESFANYSEYLWREYKYGKEDADAHLLEDTESYKQGQNYNKHLARFYYKDKEDMFDAVSYNKGGAVLHMLRKYLGDDAFYASLHRYLTDYKYQTAEVHQLRLAFEEVTGKDLNWFFNQWYFGSGHPKIRVSYDYNTLEKTVAINLVQIDKVFQFPLAIDIVENGIKTRHEVFVDGKDASFLFSYAEAPEVILINADGVLLADFLETKSLEQYMAQLKHASYYGHRRDALVEIAKQQEDKKAFNAVANAMSDSFYKIRILALEKIDLINKHLKNAVIDEIKNIATSDAKTLVQAAAIRTLGKLTDPENAPIFKEALKSKSYSVMGEALVATYYIDKPTAITLSKKLPYEVRKIIATPLTRIFIEEKDDTELVFVAKNVLAGMFLDGNPSTQALYKRAYEAIARSNNTKAIENLVSDLVAKGIQYKQYAFDTTAINLMRQMEQFQKEENVSNKRKHIEIIRTGMAQLIK